MHRNTRCHLAILIEWCKQIGGDLAVTSLMDDILPCITKPLHARHPEPEIATFLAVFHGGNAYSRTCRLHATYPPPAHPAVADRVPRSARPFASSLAPIATRGPRVKPQIRRAGGRMQQNATLRRLKQNEAAMLSPSSSSQPRAVCNDPACPRHQRAISAANRVRAANKAQHPFTFPKDSLR